MHFGAAGASCCGNAFWELLAITAMYFWEAFARAVGATTVCHKNLGAVAVVAAAARTTHPRIFFKSCSVPLLRPCISGAAAIATDFRGFLFWGVVAAITLHLFLLLVAILLLTTIIWHFQR